MKPYPLAQLFALPIQSAVRAQSLALQETLSVIEAMGFEDGKAKTFRFKAERVVEERTVDAATGVPETKFVAQPFEVSIPLLGLLPLAPMQLQEMNVDFGVEVVQPKPEPIKSGTIPAAVLGSSLAGSLSILTTLGQSNPTTMNVRMRIVKETPEGIARLGDLLTDLLSAGKGSTVEQIPGLPQDTANAIRNRGIYTVGDFLAATETLEARADLAKAIGVSATHIETWRKEARRVIGRERGPA